MAKATKGERNAYRAGWHASGTGDLDEKWSSYSRRKASTEDEERLHDAYISGWMDQAAGRTFDPEMGNRENYRALLAEEEAAR